MDEDKKRICYAIKDGFYVIEKVIRKTIGGGSFYRLDYFIDIIDNDIDETIVYVLNKEDQSLMSIDEHKTPSTILNEAKINYSEFCPYCKRDQIHSVKLHNSFLSS